MLTAPDLQALSTAQRAALFDRMATEHYASISYPLQLARDFGVNPATVYRWKESGAPWAVYYALDAWTKHLRGEERFTWAARTAIAALEKALNARVPSVPTECAE
jgi:hypothetical protein